MVPDFFPFPGLRYELGALGARLDTLTAPPYDVIDAEARARLESAHPMNAVHLILPRDPETGDRYQQAATTFRRWQESGVLSPDPPSFYIYRMGFTDDTGKGRRMLGVVGALKLSSPDRGEVLPHERTMPKPRGDRLALLRAVRANLDPVWCLSLASGLSGILEPQGPPAASCVDAGGVEHCLFPIEAGELTAAVAAAVKSAPVVIADGHHRYETALGYRDEHPDGREGGENSIMALVVELAPEQLWVKAIHRLLVGAGPGLRERLSACVTLTPVGANTPEGVRDLLARMDRDAALGLVDADGLALAAVRDDVISRDLDRLAEPLRTVDAARLEVVLGRIGAPEGLEFHHDPAVAAAAVAKGTADAAVLLRPVSIPQIQAVAAAGERMPEKTTFFQPKPLTGLVFRSLDR